MKTFCYILATLILLFLFGCSPTIIHKHYHYYPDGVSQCDTQASCNMKAAKKMHYGKKHGGKHSGGEPCHKMHGMQHGKTKHYDKHKGMKHGGMKHKAHGHKAHNHKTHGHKNKATNPCSAECPCGCQPGQACDCPERNNEQLEELFNE